MLRRQPREIPLLLVTVLAVAPAATHHEDWRFHAKVAADALQQVETLFPAVAWPWYDHVEQNEIERSP